MWWWCLRYLVALVLALGIIIMCFWWIYLIIVSEQLCNSFVFYLLSVPCYFIMILNFVFKSVFFATQLTKQTNSCNVIGAFCRRASPCPQMDQCRQRLVLQRAIKRLKSTCVIKWTGQNLTKMDRLSDNMAAARRVTMCQEVRAAAIINALTRCLRSSNFDSCIASWHLTCDTLQLLLAWE